MSKKAAPTRKAGVTRNWIAYLCEALVTSGVMPTWEAATYLTTNLFGESPNPRLLGTISAHEITAEFLRRLYQPMVEAVSREVTLPSGSTLHVFTDISLTGKSAVLVVYLPADGLPQQLLLLDAVKPWDLVFEDAEAFNLWIEERYRAVKAALAATIGKPLGRQRILAKVS